MIPTPDPEAGQAPYSAGMHPAYFEVAFHVPQPPESWPKEFGIITAWTPTGQQRTPAENMRADELLASLLKSLDDTQPVRITGYSPSTGHSEPGWMMIGSLESVRALGQRFEQDAIYWVQGDHLFVTKCWPIDADLISVGGFRQRIHNISDLEMADLN